MVFVGVGVLAACAADPNATEPVGSLGPGWPKIVPWVEVNKLDPGTVQRAVDGLVAWKAITDTAIVSTVPGGARLYPDLKARIPNLRIIPGLKTYTILVRFDSLEGWRKVAEEIREILKTADQRTILIENEEAIKEYRRGKYQLDIERFRECLRLLPNDVEYIWYPSIHGRMQQSHDRFETVCKVAADVLKVRFTDRSRSGPKDVDDIWSKRAQEKLDRLSKASTIPILYCYADDRWWRDEQIPDAVREAQREWVILYPGAKRWPDAAKLLSGRLLEAAGRPAPSQRP